MDVTQWHFRKDGDTDIFPISRKVGSGKERAKEKVLEGMKTLCQVILRTAGLL